MSTPSAEKGKPEVNLKLAIAKRLPVPLPIFIWCVCGIMTVVGMIIYLSWCQYNKDKKGKKSTLCSSAEINTHVRPLNSGDPDCSHALSEYYIKTAANACTGSDATVVDVCNLAAVLRQGYRCVDMQVFSINHIPVVAYSGSDNTYVKDSSNSLYFSDVLDTLCTHAFSSDSAPIPTDPMLLHLRIQSNDSTMLQTMATLFKKYESSLLGPAYSYETQGKNLGDEPVLSLQGKLVVILDTSASTAFLQCPELMEYVNMTSSSICMRMYPFDAIVNNADTHELTEYNKQHLTLVLPSTASSYASTNSNGTVCRTYGCQCVGDKAYLTDNNLRDNVSFFDTHTYAFVLKPADQRPTPIVTPPVVKQNPALSYAARTVSSDYYHFQV